MTIKEAKDRLAVAKEKARTLAKEISWLRDFLRSKNIDPDPPGPEKIAMIARNKSIYKAWKSGKRFTTIAEEMNLSVTRINSICKIIDYSHTKRK